MLHYVAFVTFRAPFKVPLGQIFFFFEKFCSRVAPLWGGEIYNLNDMKELQLVEEKIFSTLISGELNRREEKNFKILHRPFSTPCFLLRHSPFPSPPNPTPPPLPSSPFLPRSPHVSIDHHTLHCSGNYYNCPLGSTHHVIH